MDGGGGHDWQDRETERENEAKEYRATHKCSLDSFSDKELQTELQKRKASAKAKLERADTVAKHNNPINKQINELEKKLSNLKSNLKK